MYVNANAFSHPHPSPCARSPCPPYQPTCGKLHHSVNTSPLLTCTLSQHTTCFFGGYVHRLSSHSCPETCTTRHALVWNHRTSPPSGVYYTNLFILCARYGASNASLTKIECQNQTRAALAWMISDVQRSYSGFTFFFMPLSVMTCFFLIFH